MATKKTANVKLPSVWALLKTTFLECKETWRSLIGVVIVYGVLYFVFVLGLSFSSVSNGASSSSRISESVKSVFSVFNSTSSMSGSNQSNATVLMQFLLFLIASMALIWTLRKLQNSKGIKIRDAYYQGTSGLLPTVLVTCALILTLLPAVAGSAVLSLGLQSGNSGAEVLVSSVISILLLLGSLYLFVMFWPAFYIASLPQTRPIQALKSAAKVTKKHRFNILANFIFLLIIGFGIMFVILLVLALTVSKIVPEGAFLLLLILFGFAHVYLYNLYRSLL